MLGCDLFTESEEPNSAPYISLRIPSQYTLNHKIGDTVNFSVTANDADDDEISYKTLQNGTKINDSNSYELLLEELGTYLIQIIAYNELADTAEWQVNIENQVPIIGTIFNKTVNEDEILIGSIVDSILVTDNEDSITGVSIELNQTNEGLIKFALDSDNNIVIEDYTADGNGFSEVTVKVTDTHGAVSEESFVYNITPMTDIEGKILDSDTWEVNTSLQGFAIINGDTVWTDNNGKYKKQIDPASSIDIEAGYRSLDKTQPMSFITTARGVYAGNDRNDADIMVVTYLDNNMTPEEFRTMAWETNFKAFANMPYEGAKVPSTNMIDYLVWENRTGDVFTQAEMDDIKQTIADSIDVHLKHPFSQQEIAYLDIATEQEAQDKIRWAKHTVSNPAISTLDFNSDGIVDYTSITSPGDIDNDHSYFIASLLEEGYGSRGQFGPVTSPELEGKTIAYEFSGDFVKPADIKFIKLIEGIAYEIGYTMPKMPIDDILKIQE